MIVLDSGDKIRGDAAAAAVVDYTIYGLDNNSLKQLADGQLADSTGDLYTADSTDVVTTIVIVNTDSSARAINLFLLPSGGTARRRAEQTNLESRIDGTVKFINIKTVRKKDGDLIAMNRNGEIAILDKEGRERARYLVIYGAKLKVEDG